MRIIGGQWRGRRFAFPDVPGLRPTIDRVRETLFNWLAPVIEGARVLDLFAGSGALGLEAASRGAAEVVQVDAAREVVERLEAYRRALDTERIRVVHADALAYLAGAARPFDIAFVDPPFAAPIIEPVCTQLEAGGWLVPGARVYIETEHRRGAPALPENWELVRSKRAGRVGYHLAVRHPPGAGERAG
ncbi:MAG: 16S rRNA (guanine(966)-N(2))-methyltransferase RsmD [Gammaproteobacteria bacterium]|nr:16S rRNA (guanine(966)-N(2))-methyltransferase RsmD [Gammaproteobacteria bacterium]